MTSETTNNMLVRKLVFNNGKWTDDKRDQPDVLSVFATSSILIFIRWYPASIVELESA